MKNIILVSLLALTGCGKFNDLVATGVDGYVLRCIDGTFYVLMTSDRGLAITPHVGPDGNPKSCVVSK
jgi:hypothetical protein